MRVELGPRHHHIEHSVFEEKLGALKSFRQGLADRLFDHPRPGKTYQRAGQFEESLGVLEPLYVDLRRSLDEQSIGGPRPMATLAGLHMNLGRIYEANGEYERAEDDLLESLRLAKVIFANDPANTMYLINLSASHLYLGKFYDNRGDTAQALEQFEATLRAATEMTAREPDSLRFKREHAIALDMVGFALRKLKRMEEARDRHRDANVLFAELSEARPDDVETRRSLAVSWYFLAQLERDIAMAAESDAATRRAGLQRAVAGFDSARDIMIGIRDAGDLNPGDEGVVDMLDDQAKSARALLAESD